MTLKLRNANIVTARNQRPDISKLMDALIREKFNITLRNRFSILQDETALTIDDFNTAMMESAKETNEYTKTCKLIWISPDTWRTIEKRRQLKKKALDSKSPSLKEREQSLNSVRKTNKSGHQREETKDSMWRDSRWKKRQPKSVGI